MNVGYTFSWHLPVGDIAQVRGIIAKLRQEAITCGSEVGDLIELTGDDSQAVQPEARQAVLFTATLPGARATRFGLFSAGNSSWAWRGSVVISDVKKISDLNSVAAELGLEVAETYAGMVFTTKKNADGVLEVEQREAFDWKNF